MDDDPKLSILELVIISLTIYTILSVSLQLIYPVSIEMKKLIDVFEWICSGFFLFEWGCRFKNSKNKIRFTFFNLLDLLASFPIGFLSGFKALRLLRFLQIVKIFGSLSRFRSYVISNKIQFLKMLLFSGFSLLILISPVMILFFEEGKGGIDTAENALWWTYVTLTTIGYGDLYPVTTGGRLFTVFISLGGIGLFGILSSLIINFVVTKVKED